ncbi:Cadmium-exporting ATPase [Streptococcus parauberis]|uniref:Cation transport ATPase n=2 Tax=Streptococcus parauberis TaxID=1348 RepID=A0ABP2SX91_9STRE|nr:Cadmium-exporting ATPase [Streptococcus parauberis]EMG24808.1 Cation transport ATPase [Streptococcus parauberis KRS-02083]
MQKWLSLNRNRLTAVTGILIVGAFSIEWFIGNEGLSAFLLLLASLVGGFPIIVQAFQALRVGVVSIDFLVTLAILGAFVIQEFEE